MAAATYPEEDHDECSLHCRVVRHIACPEWHMQRAFGLLVVDERTHTGGISISRVLYDIGVRYLLLVHVPMPGVKSLKVPWPFCRFIVNYNYWRNRPTLVGGDRQPWVVRLHWQMLHVTAFKSTVVFVYAALSHLHTRLSLIHTQK